MTHQEGPGTPTIRAVIFDFGKVISSFDPVIFLRKMLPYSSLSLEQMKAALRSSMDIAVGYETGAITSEEFYRQITERTALTVDKEIFRAAYCSIFTPIETTVALIRALKPRYTLGLLSNTSEWHFTYGIKPTEVFPLFDAVTLSYEVGAMKPAREIYDDMLRKLRLPAEECLYIDDLKENADAGAVMGLHAIHYTGHEALLAALARFGVTLP